MVSTKKFGGLAITIGAGGLRFKKRKSQFNIAVGKCMEESGVSPHAGRYDRDFQREFITCVAGVGGKVSQTKLDAYDISDADVSSKKKFAVSLKRR
ncbi:MAG: hypothetical protein WCR85_00095 [Sphaerochaeta sp.]